MAKQIAKSFEVRFCERVTIRATEEEWNKLDIVARHHGQSLERLIQNAEKTRPEHIQRPEWLRQIIKTRGQCCKYYVHKGVDINMQAAQVSLSNKNGVPPNLTLTQTMSYLTKHAIWNSPTVPMREVNSNEAINFILDSKLLQANPHNSTNEMEGSVYVVFHPITQEVHLCLYSKTGKCFIFDLTKMPNNLTHMTEGEFFNYEVDTSGLTVMKEKPFPSIRQQLKL